MYKRIVENQSDIERNWKLVHLDGSMLSATQISKLQHTLDTFEPRSSRMDLLKQLIKEGIQDFDVEEFFYSMKCVDVGHKAGD